MQDERYPAGADEESFEEGVKFGILLACMFNSKEIATLCERDPINKGSREKEWFEIEQIEELESWKTKVFNFWKEGDIDILWD